MFHTKNIRLNKLTLARVFVTGLIILPLIVSLLFNHLESFGLSYQPSLYISFFNIFYIIIVFLYVIKQKKLNIFITHIDVILILVYIYYNFQVLNTSTFSVLGINYQTSILLIKYYLLLRIINHNYIKDISLFSLMIIFFIFFYILINYPTKSTLNSLKLVFNNTGILSAYLCILTPSIFLIIDLNTNSNKTLVLAIIILGLMLFILKSRSSLIAYSISIIYLLYNKTHLKNKFFYIIGFLSFTMLPLYLLMNLKKSSFKGRKFIYELCLDLCKDSPLTGYGYKSFDHLYNMHQADFFKKNIHSYDLHLLADNIHLSLNDYIHTYIENGIIGLILFLLLLYFSLSTINSIKDDKYLKSSILIFYTLCLFSYPLQIFSIQVYIISLLSWLSKTSKKQYIIKNKIIHISMYIGMIISLLYNIFNLSNTLKWKKAYELSTINQTNSLLLYKNIDFFLLGIMRFSLNMEFCLMNKINL